VRGGIVAASASFLIALAGCGQTDYASDVTEDSAQLNATITTLTDGVETNAWFEYWPAASPSNVQQTPGHDVTATGPLSDDIGGLANHTEYRYRLCGTEDDSEVVCAQERRFTTGRTTVQAYGETETSNPNAPSVQYYSDLDFDLVEDPSGVSGPAFARANYAGGFGILRFELGSHSDPEITCFSVDGNTAVVGLFNTDGTFSLQGFVQLVDGGPLGSGLDRAAVALSDVAGSPHREPTDCSPLSSGLPMKFGEIVVNEAPPAPG
jgi:hypothetical protein